MCVAISQGSEPGQVVRFETINLNSCSSWFTEMGTSKSDMYRDALGINQASCLLSPHQKHKIYHTCCAGSSLFCFPVLQVISRWTRSTSPSWRETRCWCVWTVSTVHSLYKLFLNRTDASLCVLILFYSSFFLFYFSPTENLKIVNLQGRLKSNKKLASELSFDFCIGSVGKLSDSCRLYGLCEGIEPQMFKVLFLDGKY